MPTDLALDDVRHIQFFDEPLAAHEDPEVQPRSVCARIVREAYCASVRLARNDPEYGKHPIPQWDGGENEFGTKYRTSVWPKIAVTLAKLGAEPWQYMDVQFRYSAGIPRPNQLLTDTAIERWAAARGDVDQRMREQLLRDSNQLQVGVTPIMKNLNWDENRAMRYVLANARLFGITPLFVYCTAVKYELEKIAAGIHQRALLQYLFESDGYSRIWGDFVPKALMDEAAQWQLMMCD